MKRICGPNLNPRASSKSYNQPDKTIKIQETTMDIKRPKQGRQKRKYNL